MNENEELQEFDLDDILNEFHEESEDTLPEAEEEELADIPEAELTEDTLVRETVAKQVQEEPAEENTGDTVRLEKLSDMVIPAKEEAPAPTPVPEAVSAPEPEPVVIDIDPKLRLRELKKALIAGPEKRYYELDQEGISRLQTGIFVNILIVLLCAGITGLHVMDMIPDNRLRLVIFSQVLAMLLSAWLGSHQLLDGLTDLLRLRFSIRSVLTLTFAACCADAVFCLQELRIPCCAAFSLEMTLALMARYHRHTTEMGQMDTLRKAVRLHGLYRTPDYFEEKPGMLRKPAKVEDFMDNYGKTSGPQLLQSIFCFVVLLLCGGIAVFTGMRHESISLAVQILSTSLLVAVPASFFVALTRPAAILEKRLHMVGTVLCGWQGIRNLKGKAAVPLRDEDLFPNGATKLNGVKFYGERLPNDIISRASSLVIASDSGLTGLFRQLLTTRGCREMTVKELKYYAGGIGGVISGESVLVGSSRFLQDMGVDIPQGAMVEQALYVAVDGEFSAVVAISYGKMRSAAGGLVSLSGNSKLTPVMVGSDFMITESLIRNKFGVKTKRIAFPGQDVRIQLRKKAPDEAAVAAAMTTREDLISSAYAISGARALRTAWTMGLVLHVLSGVIGLLIMLALGYLGSVTLLTPTNVLLYQLVWLAPALLITEWTRTV